MLYLLGRVREELDGVIKRYQACHTIYISIGVLVLNCRTIQNEGDKIQCVTYCKFFNTRLDVQALRRLCVWLLSVP